MNEAEKYVRELLFSLHTLQQKIDFLLSLLILLIVTGCVFLWSETRVEKPLYDHIDA